MVTPTILAGTPAFWFTGGVWLAHHTARWPSAGLPLYYTVHDICKMWATEAAHSNVRPGREHDTTALGDLGYEGESDTITVA